ncbi:MAG: FAD-dependent monooxygenase [Polyangiaceae bacterium]|nr:FAD-dependent monooxygenase [Polyangiaceae bacterium]
MVNQQAPSSAEQNVGVAVVGGGPVGLTTAMLLARRGHDVHVFEGRDDPRIVPALGGRSISLTLATRGWHAIRRIGAEERVQQITIPLWGRMIHGELGELRFQPYGANGEALASVSRSALTQSLLDHAETYENVHLHFGWRCVGVRTEDGTLSFHADGRAARVRANVILAADGASSGVRRSLLGRPGFSLTRWYCRHFYRELSTPPGIIEHAELDKNALHIWPRGECMLVAFANPLQGLTCTLFLPFEGDVSFRSLASPDDVREFFTSSFSDIAHWMPQLASDFFSEAPSSLVSLRCAPWVFDGRVALIGDAAHAMYPFLGQGLNAGLEDATTLADFVTAYGDDWASALAHYESARRENCDAVIDIAAEHYDEIARSARESDFILRKRLESRLTELFPDELASPYHVVSFTNRPYTEARHTADLQTLIIDRMLAHDDLAARIGSEELDHELRRLAFSYLRGSVPP